MRCLLLLLAAVWPAAWALPDRAAVLTLGASVLRIEAPRDQGGYALGSGVMVDADKVVTNCHVTRDAREIHVVHAGSRWRVAAQAIDVEHDLCVLLVPGMRARSVALGRAADLKVGQSVIALGYSGGMGLQASSGEVTELHRHDGASVIQTSNQFRSGASGGGLFDDEGRLVGVLTFSLRGGQAYYFAAPAEWVQQMLEDPSAPAKFREVMPIAMPQLAYWQRPADQQPNFLKAAALRHEDRWADLATMAKQWLHADANDAEPWYLLGLALENLSEPAAARHALGCALRIEPERGGARRRLVALLARQGFDANRLDPAWPCLPAAH